MSKCDPFFGGFGDVTFVGRQDGYFRSKRYRNLLDAEIENQLIEAELKKAYSDVRAFERQLKDSGTVILKFFRKSPKKNKRLACLPCRRIPLPLGGFPMPFCRGTSVTTITLRRWRCLLNPTLRVNPHGTGFPKECQSRHLSGATASGRCFVRWRQGTKEGGRAGNKGSFGFALVLQRSLFRKYRHEQEPAQEARRKARPAKTALRSSTMSCTVCASLGHRLRGGGMLREREGTSGG